MTTIKLTCPWCEEDVDRKPEDVFLTARNARADRGVYRWYHCQTIIRPAVPRVFEVLNAAGCPIEYTDDHDVDGFADFLEGVETIADLGLVS